MRKTLLTVGLLVAGCVLVPATYAHCGGCGAGAPEAKKTFKCPVAALSKIELTAEQEKLVKPLKEAFLKALKSVEGMTCDKSAGVRTKATTDLCAGLSKILTADQVAAFKKLCPLAGKDCCAAGQKCGAK